MKPIDLTLTPLLLSSFQDTHAPEPEPSGSLGAML